MLKQQFLIEESHYKQASIFEVSKEAVHSFTSLIEMASEMAHFINLRYLKKRNEQLGGLVLDFITDHATGMNHFLQIKFASTKPLDPSHIVRDRLDASIRKRHTKSLDATFGLA